MVRGRRGGRELNSERQRQRGTEMKRHERGGEGGRGGGGGENFISL